MDQKNTIKIPHTDNTIQNKTNSFLLNQNQKNELYELTKNIRNMQILNKTEIDFIKTLPTEKLLEIIEIYNDCMKLVNELIMQL